MNTLVEQYINSGMLEAYVMGVATAAEEQEIRQLKRQYPEVREALFQLEVDMENIAMSMAIEPPPGTWDKIESEIEGLIVREQTIPKAFAERGRSTHTAPDRDPQFIEIEAESSHIRIHKTWRWVFAAIFILGKLFLVTAIYFYLENRQAQQQIKELKTEIKSLK